MINPVMKVEVLSRMDGPCVEEVLQTGALIWVWITHKTGLQ